MLGIVTASTIGKNITLFKRHNIFWEIFFGISPHSAAPRPLKASGFANLPARMAEQASAMYAQNMANLLRHVHGKGGLDE